MPNTNGDERRRRFEAEAKALPKVSPFVVDAITDMLLTDHGPSRPPEKTAALLALVAELYERGMAFPHREVAAIAINGSKWTIDSILSSRIDEGYITLDVRTESGNVAARRSTVKRRYLVPSKKLLNVVKEAKKIRTRK